MSTIKDFNGFKATLERAKEQLLNSPIKRVTIIHHDDADGLTSAAVLKESLERQGWITNTICLEKTYPEVLRRLHSTENENYIYADLGSAHAKLISNMNDGRNLTIILDHHDTEHVEDPKVLNVNPEPYQISGEEEASGATIAFLFAKTLSPYNKDLAHLSVIGSAEIPGPLKGLNREALTDALRSGKVEVEDNKYLVSIQGVKQPWNTLSSKLTVLGAVGYYQGGPKLAIDYCLEKNVDIDNLVKELENKRRKANQLLLARIEREGLKRTGSIQWLHAGDTYAGMGVKVIGTFLSYLSFQRKLIDRSKYLVGFMNMSPEIPGLTRLNTDYVKVSARVPDALSVLIKRGVKAPLSKLLPEAAEAMGGFGDGHTMAASGIIPKGRELQFINFMERATATKQGELRTASLMRFMT